MLSIIVAVAKNGVIGCANRLIWHISEDLQRFKAITSGHTVVMGRKTFESIGRPLPNRTNVIITRQADFQAPGCTVVHSLEEAIALFPPSEELFVIGGGEIYGQALPLAEKLYITVVEKEYAGDTLFPCWEPDQWTLEHEEHYPHGATFEHPYTFQNYMRRAR